MDYRAAGSRVGGPLLVNKCSREAKRSTGAARDPSPVRGCCGYLLFAVLPRRMTGQFLEDFCEGASGLVTNRLGNLGDRFAGRVHPVLREQHPPACQVVDRRLTHSFSKLQ